MVNKDLVEKKKEIVAKLNVLDISQENELREVLREFIEMNPLGYFNSIKHRKFRKLYDFVIANTKFIDYKTGFNTKCWYAVNNIHELMKCKTCNKPIRRSFRPLVDRPSDLYFCSTDCTNANDEYRKKISNVKKNKTITFSLISDRPPECNITYKENLIEYDDEMNNKLKLFYELHQRTFRYWIEKDKELKTYLFEKSYPLDFTNLNVETRVFWVLNRLQRIPRYKTCGRQLDFQNIKFSRGFPDFCSNECIYKQNTAEKSLHFTNAKKCYEKMLRSSMVEILFDLTEFSKFKDDSFHMFKCKCKICGNEFKNKFDKNFYGREGNRQSFFKCPKCFPFSKQHSSCGERELKAFIEEICPLFKIQLHNKKLLWPYELDIYVKDLNLAFEFNGVYWHSAQCIKHNEDCNEYKKTLICENKQIKLVHIWEDDWKNNKEKVKEMIKTIIYDENAILKLSSINDEFVLVDRSIFNLWSLPSTFQVIEIIDPKMVSRPAVNGKKHFDTWDCGYFKCKYLNYGK